MKLWFAPIRNLQIIIMAPRGRFELPGGFRPTSFPGLRLGPLGHLGTRVLNHAGKNGIDTQNIDVPAFEKFLRVQKKSL
jgi:hypothetical protein